MRELGVDLVDEEVEGLEHGFYLLILLEGSLREGWVWGKDRIVEGLC